MIAITEPQQVVYAEKDDDEDKPTIKNYVMITKERWKKEDVYLNPAKT